MNSTLVMIAGLALVGSARGAIAADLELVVQDAGGKPVNEALAYAQPVGTAAPPARTSARAVIDQVNKEFVPRVSIVQAGTQVFFPNSDNIRHSIYSFSPAKTFTTKLYSGREAAPILFDKTGLVVLGCNIHDTMVAWIFIVDTPWIAKSGVNGVATLKGLPDGDYIVTTAAPSHSLKPNEMKLTINGGGTGTVNLKVTLGAGS